MSTTLSPNIAAVLDPAMQAVFVDGLIRISDINHYLWCKVRPSGTKTIEKTSINAPGAYGSHVEGNDFSFSALTQGNGKTYTMSESALAFSISSLSYGFLDRTALGEFVQQLGSSAARKLSADAYAVLSGGFTDTGPDGVSLFNGAHTAAAGGTQSNTGSSALDEGSLQAALTTLRREKTPDGILASNTPRFLVVPPELEYMANELTKSALSGNDMQVNGLASKGLTVVVAPDMTDATDWMVLSDNFRCYQYIAKGASPKQWIDQDSDNWKVSDRMIHTQGYDNFRGSFGASVAG
jgi:hypothetical protein